MSDQFHADGLPVKADLVTLDKLRFRDFLKKFYNRGIPDEAKELRQSELEEFALHLIDLHKNEKDIRAIELWYGPEMWSQDHATAQDEKLAVWEMLRGESRLRSTIKANKPEVASSDS